MVDLYPVEMTCYRCNASKWEQIGEFVPSRGKPQDVVACIYCGARMRVNPVKRAEPPQKTGEFRFGYGRFKGLTFAEADAEPNGRRYLEHLRDTNEKLKDRIEEYLTSAAPSA